MPHYPIFPGADPAAPTEEQRQAAFDAGWEHFYSGDAYTNPMSGHLANAYAFGYLAAKRCARECREAGVGA